MHDHGKPRQAVYFELSQRQSDVLYWIGHGLDNKQIGAALGISPRTVQVHLRYLMRKTHIANRYVLRSWALTYPEAVAYKRAPLNLQVHPPGCPCDGDFCGILRRMSPMPTLDRAA